MWNMRWMGYLRCLRNEIIKSDLGVLLLSVIVTEKTERIVAIESRIVQKLRLMPIRTKSFRTIMILYAEINGLKGIER